MFRFIVFAFFGIILVMVSKYHFKYNNTIRRQVLKEKTDIWFGRIFIVSFLKQSESSSLEDNVAETLHDLALVGGSEAYVGRVVENVIKSKQLTFSQEFDLVLLSSWPCHKWYDSECLDDTFTKLRDEFGEIGFPGNWTSVYSVGILPSFPKVLLAQIMFFFNVINTFSGQTFPLVEHAKKPIEDNTHHSFNELAELARIVEEDGQANDGLLIWNLLKRGNQEEVAEDTKYGIAMMKMLAYHGGGPMHLGQAQPFSGLADFEDVVAMYYPDRQFFVNLLRSAWFHANVQGKKPGDTLAVITVPYTYASSKKDHVTG